MVRSVLAATLILATASTAHAWFPGVTPTSWSAITSPTITPWSEPDDHGDWGAGITTYGRTTYNTNLDAADSVTLEATVEAWARTFGDKFTLFRFRGDGTSTVGGGRRYETRMWGRSFPFGTWKEYPYKSSTSTSVAITMPETMIPIYQVEARFFAVLTARAVGRIDLGYTATGTWSGASANITFKPYAQAVAHLTFSADAIVLEAGVYGDLNLIDASVPIRTAATSNPACPGVTLTSDVGLQLKQFSGEVGLFARLIAWRKEWELGSWSGTKQDIPIDARTVNVCW